MPLNRRYLSEEKGTNGKGTKRKEEKQVNKTEPDKNATDKKRKIPPSFRDAKPFIKSENLRTTRRPSADEQKKI